MLCLKLEHLNLFPHLFPRLAFDTPVLERILHSVPELEVISALRQAISNKWRVANKLQMQSEFRQQSIPVSPQAPFGRQ